MKNFHKFRGIFSLVIFLLCLTANTTRAQISLVKDLAPGPGGIGKIYSVESSIVELNGFLYVNSFGELIRTNGTASGTRTIENILTDRLTQWDGNVYYINYDDGAIYKTDGTPFKAKSFWPDEPDGETLYLVSAENGFYIVRYEVRPSDNGDFLDGYFLYFTDGTSVFDLNVRIVFGGDLESQGGVTFFEADTGFDPGIYSLAKIQDNVVEIINPLQNSIFTYSFDRMATLNGDLIHFPTV